VDCYDLLNDRSKRGLRDDGVDSDLSVPGFVLGELRAPADQGRLAGHTRTAAGALPRPGGHGGQGNRQLVERLV
jgi:hypothetical protein